LVRYSRTFRIEISFGSLSIYGNEIGKWVLEGVVGFVCIIFYIRFINNKYLIGIFNINYYNPMKYFLPLADDSKGATYRYS